MEDQNPPRSIFAGHEWMGTHAPRLTATHPAKDVYRLLRSCSSHIVPDENYAEQFVVPGEPELVRHRVGQDEDHARASFPTERRIVRRPLITSAEVPDHEIIRWWESEGPRFGNLVPQSVKMHHMRVWYTYRDCGAHDIADMGVPTDLYVHRVRLKPETQPWRRSKRRAWSNSHLYWLNKLTQECIDAGMYESTMLASGRLSDWTAMPVLVAKDRDKDIETQDPRLEPRLTVNYSKVEEDLPGTNLPLMADVHQRLSDPRVGSFSKFDLKHGYWSILVHPECRHILAFEVPGFPQLQPTRMPQGTQSAGHSMSEMMRIMLGPIPHPKPEPSLTAPRSPGSLIEASEYIDDVFATHASVGEQMAWIEYHFLPRILWSRLKLSFKKVFIGCEEIAALGMIHRTYGRVSVKHDRAEKLRIWPVPVNQTHVRQFMGSLGPTRRWIKNCSEIARPLTRLQGNVPWQWKSAEALSFNLLREKAASTVEMHGHVLDDPVDLYSDASGYGAGCLIMQIQSRTPKPILYDSFLFTKTQRNYGTYKRELCAIVEFSRRHERYLRAPVQSVIHTDHKPLTFFLHSVRVEGIYARWADELRSLNVRIVYIDGARNAVADALSRTIFTSEECEDDLSGYGDVNEEGLWIWKDGNGGYESMLKSLEENEKAALIEKLSPTYTLKENITTEMNSRMTRLWNWSDDEETGYIAQLRELLPPDFHGSENEMWSCLANPQTRLSSKATVIASRLAKAQECGYAKSLWYRDVWKFLSGLELDNLGRLGLKALRDRSKSFRIREENLEHYRRGIWRRCLLENEVSQALRLAHDEGGHFSPAITLKKLNQTVYWPCMGQDTQDYFLGCLRCAKYNPAKPKSPDLSVTICEPFQIAVLDFVGPFPISMRGNRYILCIVDMFSRYGWAYPTKDCDTDAAFERTKEWKNQIGTTPLAVYADPGSAFISDSFNKSLEEIGIEVLNAPSTSHKSVGLVEIFNRVVQNVLNKLEPDVNLQQSSENLEGSLESDERPRRWDEKIPHVVRNVNARHMEHIGFSPFEILHGHLPRGAFESEYPPEGQENLRSAMSQGTYIVPADPEWHEYVVKHVARIQYCQEVVRSGHEIRRAQKQAVHNRRNQRLQEDDFVMVLQEGKQPKLTPKWRGPFRIKTREGRQSFKLSNLDGSRISPREYHEDSLKLFVPRTGHLRTEDDLSLPFRQQIRRPRPRARKKKKRTHTLLV